jgi:hypothetical protein
MAQRSRRQLERDVKILLQALREVHAVYRSEIAAGDGAHTDVWMVESIVKTAERDVTELPSPTAAGAPGADRD